MATEQAQVVRHSLHPVAVGLLITIIVLLAALTWRQLAPGMALESQSGYFALLLSNGQTFFGRIEQKDPELILLTDAHYIKSSTNQETGQTSNLLTRRGSEIHSPTRMFIMTKQVVLMEPVAPESEVSRLMEKIKAQTDG